jgi:hypothetical protein
MVTILIALTSDLTEAEWNTFLTTVQQATHTLDPETNLTIWELGLKKHHELGVQMHGGNPLFGYAHRMFLRWFEEKLQALNPNFAFFYWDTGKEFSTWSKSKIWNYMGTQQGRVRIPAFNGTRFSYLNNAQLERRCDTSKNPPPSEYYFELWTRSKDKGYSDYCKQLEYAHGVMHNLVGGQLSRLQTSPLDPIFYAHHSNVDYTLLKAQLLWASDSYPLEKSYGPDLTLNTTIPGFPGTQVGDVIDVADICVRYVPSKTTSVPPINNTTGTNTTGTNTTGTNTTGTNVTNSTLVPTVDVKNFTLDLSDEWLQSSFRNNSAAIRNEAQGIQESLNDKVDRGETIITRIVSDDESRSYLGVKAEGVKNIKRMQNTGSSSFQFGFTTFLFLMMLL